MAIADGVALVDAATAAKYEPARLRFFVAPCNRCGEPLTGEHINCLPYEEPADPAYMDFNRIYEASVASGSTPG